MVCDRWRSVKCICNCFISCLVLPLFLFYRCLTVLVFALRWAQYVKHWQEILLVRMSFCTIFKCSRRIFLVFVGHRRYGLHLFSKFFLLCVVSYAATVTASFHKTDYWSTESHNEKLCQGHREFPFGNSREFLHIASLFFLIWNLHSAIYRIRAYFSNYSSIKRVIRL